MTPRRPYPLALVVDDSPAVRKGMESILVRLKLHCEEAVDGADAWKRLQSFPADIIFTDINMPVMDGLKLIRLVRAGGPHQRTPVVVVSTEGAEPDRKRALALGASAYLVKPVQSREVAELVASLLVRARAAPGELGSSLGSVVREEGNRRVAPDPVGRIR